MFHVQVQTDKGEDDADRFRVRASVLRRMGIDNVLKDEPFASTRHRVRVDFVVSRLLLVHTAVSISDGEHGHDL